MTGLEYKQSVQLVSMMMNAGRDKEALKLAKETFADSRRMDDRLIFMLYELSLRQGDTKEAAVYLLYLAFVTAEDCIDRMNGNNFMKRLEDYAAPLGYLVMLDAINRMPREKVRMTSETRADYSLFVKNQFDREIDGKICSVDLARFRSAGYRCEAISLGSGKVLELLAQVNDGRENDMKLRFMREVYRKVPLEEFHCKINALNELCERYDLYATESGIKREAEFFQTSPDRRVMDGTTADEYALLKKAENEFDAIAYSRYDDVVKYTSRLLGMQASAEGYRMRAQAYEARDRFREAFDDYGVEALLRAFRYRKLMNGDDEKLVTSFERVARDLALEYIIAYNHYAWTIDRSRAFAYAVKVSKAGTSGKVLLAREYPEEAASDELAECEEMLSDSDFMGNIKQLGIDLIERYLVPMFSRSNYGRLPDNFRKELMLTVSDAEYWEALEALEGMPAVIGQTN